MLTDIDDEKTYGKNAACLCACAIRDICTTPGKLFFSNLVRALNISHSGLAGVMQSSPRSYSQTYKKAFI
jgi:hypothetical protein